MNTFHVGDKVETQEVKTFDGYVGQVVEVVRTRMDSPLFVRVAFPGHPWSKTFPTFAFYPRELRRHTAGATA